MAPPIGLTACFVVPTVGNCVQLNSVGEVAMLAGMVGTLVVAVVWVRVA